MIDIGLIWLLIATSPAELDTNVGLIWLLLAKPAEKDIDVGLIWPLLEKSLAELETVIDVGLL